MSISVSAVKRHKYTLNSRHNQKAGVQYFYKIILGDYFPTLLGEALSAFLIVGRTAFT